MTNRDRATLLLVITLGASKALAQRFDDGEIETVPVRGNLSMLVMEPAGNVGVSVGPDGAYIIDNQFAPMTNKIISAVKELTDQPIRYVFNTHWHGDHTGGNNNFGGMGYAIVAHDNVRERMLEDQYHLFFKAGTPPAPAAALPVMTYDNEISFHLNGDHVRVIHTPNAHTDGDSIFYFEKADVLQTGDVFINRGFPLIDIHSNGSIAGQIEATNRMLEIAGPNTIIIPGHGPLTDEKRMEEIRDMLVETRSRVTALLDKNMTLEEILDQAPLADLEEQWGYSLVTAEAFTTIIYQSETGDWEPFDGKPPVDSP